ncbi:PREDICTED: longitudinals lacking protein, isoforms F/I/K/T-like [Dinoponera quadriceps]|uniref:Longitudinals lacking protein, isoforms F/I/K/T-like n=1 Tax=Dinoponera quadriceps TaxID=609295 RepID=A0A6P3XVY8_DINQU|nr:PREDICTED: longitudinals lacking protein, isoforms F/I/K/T-like [Dinoponera quadriceps]
MFFKKDILQEVFPQNAVTRLPPYWTSQLKLVTTDHSTDIVKANIDDNMKANIDDNVKTNTDDNAKTNIDDNIKANIDNNVKPDYGKVIVKSDPDGNAKSDQGKDCAKPSSSARYNCESCGKPYRTRASLNYHRSVECKKDPKFGCPFCAYKSRRRSNLRRHMLLHYNTRPRKDKS